MYGYSARILAFVIATLIEKRFIIEDQLTIEGVEEVVQSIKDELIWDNIFKNIWQNVLSLAAWYSKPDEFDISIDSINVFNTANIEY